jgi:hypothetical protein
MDAGSRPGATMGSVGTPVLWIIVGINAAWVTGTLGGLAFETGDDGQAILYAIATIAGGTAAFLLAVRHTLSRRHFAAAGFAFFAVLAVGEAVAGFTGPGPEAVLGSLAVLHAPAMWLIAAEDWSLVWARAAAALSGLFFLIYGMSYTLGTEPADPDDPLLIIGYLTLIVAIIGWTLTLRSEGDLPSTTTAV